MTLLYLCNKCGARLEEIFRYVYIYQDRGNVKGPVSAHLCKPCMGDLKKFLGLD